jgi:hypothetical protein
MSLIFNTHHEAEIFQRVFVKFIQQFTIIGHKPWKKTKYLSPPYLGQRTWNGGSKYFTDLLRTIEPPSFLVDPAIIGTELIWFDSISFLGSAGRNGDSLSISTRGPNPTGQTCIIYKKKSCYITEVSCCAAGLLESA